MKNIIPILFLGSGIVLYIVAFLAIISLKKVYNISKDNTFANTYGYEYYKNFPLYTRVVIYVLLILAAICIGVGTNMFLNEYFVNIYMIIIGSLFSVACVLISVSNILPLSLYKVHIFVFFAGDAFIGSFAFLFFFGKFANGILFQMEKELIPSAIAIIMSAIFVISVAFIINPKNSSWYKLEKKQINDKVSYIKPKVNFLALEEWLSILLIIIVSILLIINNIILLN